MKISLGGNRNSKNWQEYEISFDELSQRVSRPTITSETFSQFLNMPATEQDNLKDVGGFVGGRLKDGRRTKNNVLDRSLLALDADNLSNSDNLDRMIDQLNTSGYEFTIYSTKKHTKDKPRIRLLIPFSQPIEPEGYEPIARKICQDLGMGYFDPTTCDINRLMFFPSVSRDMVDDFIWVRNVLPGKPLDPLVFLQNNYRNWKDISEWPRFPHEEDRVNRKVKTQQDPLEKEGIIGYFCQAYSIQEAIATFLPEVYAPVADDRYTYLNGSTTGGAVVYDNKFLYSHHATDPASEQLCNAFDLVRLHKFGSDKKTSVKDMLKFAAKDKRVKDLMLKDEAQQIMELQAKAGEVNPEDQVTYKELLQKLSKNDKGENESTIDNILLILKMDPTLKGFYYDVFREWVVVTEKMPWADNTVEEFPRGWIDGDDSGLRWYLEKYYGITGVQKMLDALNICFQTRSVHPVRDYFESLEWDGIPRIENLLIDYFGADDNCYTREVMRKALAAAVTRIYRPGTKFDNMPIIVGTQGIGKSTFLAYLGKDWFSDSLTEFSGKDAMELLNGNLIIEIGELNGFRKTEMDQIKQFLSKQVDEYRAAYARRKEAHKRQCVIFGTTNESTFLRDNTGNRRFLPVQTYPERVKKSVWDDLPGEVDQIWAEAFTLFQLGEDLRLSPEAEKLAKQEQAYRLEEDPRKAMIIEFIQKPIPDQWLKMSISQHQDYWRNPNIYDGKLVNRDRICAAEIITELFNESYSRTDKRLAREINSILDSIPGLEKQKNQIRCSPGYGKTTGYYIKEIEELEN